ncbi:hypothetical protein GWI33_015847 [Rhynchophorus ferrugineus]|uniref:Uncharacterized protein n=1 Tax=Rhynchophorus ferrugineus TaxID=354439 RepID=A0A834I1N9_RHYFE|nr:hypothetical protein GWI33_015847 [Rhynchophorus ferrugineus]
MDKIEFRILIKYCFLKGKNTVEAKTWLDVDFDWQATFEENESAASPRQCTVSKIHELGFELIPNPPYSPDLAPNDYFLFSELKGKLAGKKCSSNEEVIDEIEACYEV